MLWSGNPPLTFLSDSTNGSDHSHKCPLCPTKNPDDVSVGMTQVASPFLWLPADSLDGWMKNINTLSVRMHGNLIPVVRSEPAETLHQ